jgi:hypothetical protein
MGNRNSRTETLGRPNLTAKNHSTILDTANLEQRILSDYGFKDLV